MKTIKVFLLSLFVVVAMCISAPVFSQDNPTPAQTERYDDDDNDRNYSWIGLLGLLGLAGLIKKDRNVPVTRGTGTPSTAGTTGSKYTP